MKSSEKYNSSRSVDAYESNLDLNLSNRSNSSNSSSLNPGTAIGGKTDNQLAPEKIIFPLFNNQIFLSLIIVLIVIIIIYLLLSNIFQSNNYIDTNQNNYNNLELPIATAYELQYNQIHPDINYALKNGVNNMYS